MQEIFNKIFKIEVKQNVQFGIGQKKSFRLGTKQNTKVTFKIQPHPQTFYTVLKEFGKNGYY